MRRMICEHKRSTSKNKNGKGKMRKRSQALVLEDSYFSYLSSEFLLKQQEGTVSFVIIKEKKDQFVRRFYDCSQERRYYIGQ